MTTFAIWLNTFFASFDQAILKFAYSLHESAVGGFLDVFFKEITKLGNGGIFFIVLSVILLLFKKTRKCGFAMLIAIVIGALITNVCIKNIVGRPRPYADETSIYYQWWLEIGHGVEHEIASFPSGHATASFAAMTALFIFLNKKYSWLGLVLASLIGFSRNYIFVHYPSDILAGIIVGVCAALLAAVIIRAIFKALENSRNRGAVFVTTFNLPDLWRRKAVPVLAQPAPEEQETASKK